MGSFSPFSKEELLPQAETLEIKKKKGELFIGLPKETYLGEKRVCLTPDAVSALCAHGHRIVVETGAGDNAIILIANILKLVQKYLMIQKKLLNVI